MELEFHQLDLRYDRLRVRQSARERRLLASLAEVGQQMPIVVVTSDARDVVVDGHKRVRCLHQLHRDLVAAVVWEMATADALIFRHLLQTDAPENVFEQAWLIARRAHRRLQHGGGLLPPDRARAWRVFEAAQLDFPDLHRRCEQELQDARPGTVHSDCEPAGEGAGDSPDRAGARDLTRHGPDGAERRQPDGAPA